MGNPPPLVSIIMPAYNAEGFIAEAIASVQNQTHNNWELLIVNDGSVDATEQEVQKIDDPRIHYFSQKNAGASAARNKALRQMKGDYFCFLDADDILPPNAITARLKVFDKDEKIAFVSGKVVEKNITLDQELSVRCPTFRGYPKREIIRLSSAVLVAITWLIKRNPKREYKFQEGWTHSEDVAFFLSISNDGLYDFTEEEVLVYRRNEGSAMSNLKGLEDSYVKYYYYVLETIKDLKKEDKKYLKKRIVRIMVLSYIANKQFFAAIKAFYRLIRL